MAVSTSMLVALRAAPTPVGRTALGRALTALAAQCDLSIDRIEDAGLVTEEMLAGLERSGAPLAVAVDVRHQRLGVMVGPFANGVARSALTAGAAPGIGPIVDRVADAVTEHAGDAGELIEVAFGERAATDGSGPELSALLIELHSRPAIAGFVACLPAVAESASVIRQAIGGIGHELGLAYDVIDDIKLAVSEACANVVVHAYPDEAGPLEVEFRPGDDSLAVTIHDQGIGMTPHQPRAEGPPSVGLGLGLELMATLSREMSIAVRPGGGTSIRLVFGLSPDGETDS